MISLQHLYKSFGGKPVLQDMSIDVERGAKVSGSRFYYLTGQGAEFLDELRFGRSG